MQYRRGLKRGSIVRSKAGRDFGRLFVIMDFDGEFAIIADGDLRKLKKPKRKNLKHLAKLNKVIDLEIKDLNDSYLRKSLQAYIAKEEL